MDYLGLTYLNSTSFEFKKKKIQSQNTNTKGLVTQILTFKI